MFFVLSGFVLSLKFIGEDGRKLNLLPFYARRITRIWIPWFCFFAISLAIFKLYHHSPQPTTTIPSLTEHHRTFWSIPSSQFELVKQMIFQLHDSSKRLIPQDWSLEVEFKAAVIMPLIIYFTRKGFLWGIALGIAIYLIIPKSSHVYLSFSMGALAAKIYLISSKKTGTINYQNQSIFFGKYFGTMALLFGFLLYQIRWFAMSSATPGFLANGPIIWNISSLGCSLIILGAAHSTAFKRLLVQKPMLFIGRISFSLYLVQSIVIIAIAPYFLRALNSLGLIDPSLLQFLTIIFVVTLSILLATLGEYLFERPSVALGKVLTKIMERYPKLLFAKI